MSYFLRGWRSRWSFAVAVTATVAATVATACISAAVTAVIRWRSGCSAIVVCCIVSFTWGVRRIRICIRLFNYVSRTTLSRSSSRCKLLRRGTAGFTACKFSGFCTNRLFLNGRWHLEIFILISFMNTFHNIFPNLHMETLAKTFHRFVIIITRPYRSC